jgi:sulfur carrier protein
MLSPLTVQLNGQPRTFSGLSQPTDLASVINSLALQADRIAVELNGTIVPRQAWAATPITEGDRLEIVHFVGGGTA